MFSVRIVSKTFTFLFIQICVFKKKSESDKGNQMQVFGLVPFNLVYYCEKTKQNKTKKKHKSCF